MLCHFLWNGWNTEILSTLLCNIKHILHAYSCDKAFTLLGDGGIVYLQTFSFFSLWKKFFINFINFWVTFHHLRFILDFLKMTKIWRMGYLFFLDGHGVFGTYLFQRAVVVSYDPLKYLQKSCRKTGGWRYEEANAWSEELANKNCFLW